MSRAWVVNASPLIALGAIGKIGLLPQLSGHLIVPAVVAEEVADGPPSDAALLWVAGEGRRYVHAERVLDPLVASWDLGPGETAVLSMCRDEPDREAILDDPPARRCAAALGIPVRGTLGVIILAKRKGLVARAEPLFEQLLAQGFRAGPALIQTALRLAGE